MGAARTALLLGWTLAGLAVLGSAPPTLAETVPSPTPRPASTAPRSAPNSPLPKDQGFDQRPSRPGIGICIGLGPIRVEITLGGRCGARKSPPPPIPTPPPTRPPTPTPLPPPTPTSTSTSPELPSPVPLSPLGAPSLRVAEPRRSTPRIPSPAVSSPTPTHRVRVLESAPQQRQRNPLGTVLILIILSIAIAIGSSLAFGR
jgi:hypothetical protein